MPHTKRRWPKGLIFLLLAGAWLFLLRRNILVIPAFIIAPILWYGGKTLRAASRDRQRE